MKRSIFITGVSGSGKSTVIKKLLERGYSAHDIEHIQGLFTTSEAASGRVLTEWDNTNIEQIKGLRWNCDIEKLKTIIFEEQNPVAFYSGTASNIDEVVSLFTDVMLLQTSPEIIRHRLSTRTTHDFARTKEVQDWILGWKEEWDKHLIDRGAIAIDANGPVEDTVEKVVGAFPDVSPAIDKSL